MVTDRLGNISLGPFKPADLILNSHAGTSHQIAAKAFSMSSVRLTVPPEV